MKVNLALWIHVEMVPLGDCIDGQITAITICPAAGLRMPDEVENICVLTKNDIIMDRDEHAAAIYYPLEQHVAAFLTTDIARAIVDLNRAEDDFCKDGVIKTHTCWDVPVYREHPSSCRIGSSLADHVSQALSQSTQVSSGNGCDPWS